MKGKFGESKADKMEIFILGEVALGKQILAIQKCEMLD